MNRLSHIVRVLMVGSALILLVVYREITRIQADNSLTLSETIARETPSLGRGLISGLVGGSIILIFCKANGSAKAGCKPARIWKLLWGATVGFGFGMLLTYIHTSFIASLGISWEAGFMNLPVYLMLGLLIGARFEAAKLGDSRAVDLLDLSCMLAVTPFTITAIPLLWIFSPTKVVLLCGFPLCCGWLIGIVKACSLLRKRFEWHGNS